MRSMSECCKRISDVALTTLVIVITSPLWLVIAAAIRLSSKGPAIYVANRAGRDGTLFHMYKFRTMYADTGHSQPGITAGDDPRITRVGHVLRATKLDELPQLINVLRGDMSLVGPRPEAPEYVTSYDARQRHVLSIRPGITGPTQLAFVDEASMLAFHNVEDMYRSELLPRKLEMDLQYVWNRSFWSDVRILVATGARLLHR